MANDAVTLPCASDQVSEIPGSLELYRWAVQDPEVHATVLSMMHRRLRPGTIARVLREDFAGTSADSVAWVAIRPDRRAIAVDLDGQTLAWAKDRASRILGGRAALIDFIHGDVMDVEPGASIPSADVLAVLNFSIMYVREESRLRGYLSHARRCLAADGVLVMNLFGGPASLRIAAEPHRVTPSPRLPRERPIPPFDYTWEVRRYDPSTREIQCSMHFGVTREGRTAHVRDAFVYDWRVWSIAEMIDACRAVGFSTVQVWRHTFEPAAGVFLGPVDPRALDDLDVWTAYIVASP